MTSSGAAQGRQRGEIEKRAGGSLRVRVYAGIDPLTDKRHYLTETIPPGPRAAREAEKARTRLLAQVDERRNPLAHGRSNGRERLAHGVRLRRSGLRSAASADRNVLGHHPPLPPPSPAPRPRTAEITGD